MGIHYFNHCRWLVQRYPDIVHSLNVQYLTRFDNLYMDFTTIILMSLDANSQQHIERRGGADPPRTFMRFGSA